ncbi:acyltransferase family protein [Rugamonas sp. CCM 8940]|uniref:acyltransferase family protein n=1 Tax=Rugamonas sp. CCM 8940 TaxID=2765359 RepID=UPI0018F7C01A|nr:acyltransferase [Rugamonas sp. CCM 8940]MBJ7309188.1 acyltransferase [Rugamonas sp. CCM 8940]
MTWLSERFELSHGDGAQPLRPMEGLRGLAVLLVFLVHYTTLAAPWLDGASLSALLARLLHLAGNSGVDLFFVLSGYLIYGSLIARRQAFLPFMRRRLMRIYPTYGAVFLLYLALSLAVPAESKIPPAAVDATRYLLHNLLLLAPLLGEAPLITVSWSLSYELFYYLATPLLIAAFGLRRRRRRWRVAFLFAVAGAIVAGYLAFGVPLRSLMFVAGALLHEARGHRRDLGGRRRPPGEAVTLAALAGALVLLMLPLAAPLKIVVLAAALYRLCLCCFERAQGRLARVFCFAPLRWLGNMSYSYYLLHGLLLKAALAALARLPQPEPGPLLFWGMLPLLLAVTLAGAAALFLLVERPLSLAPRRASFLASQA